MTAAILAVLAIVLLSVVHHFRKVNHKLDGILEEVVGARDEAAHEASRVRQLDLLAGVWSPTDFETHVDQALAQAEPGPDLRRIR